jgi:hypothetical protein
MSDSSAPADPDTCAICGKVTANSRGFMRLQVEGRMIELCCPMCLTVHQKEVALAEEEKRHSGAREIGWDEQW